MLSPEKEILLLYLFIYIFVEIILNKLVTYLAESGSVLTLLHSERPKFNFNLLHSERPKLYTILAFLSAIGLKKIFDKIKQC